MKYEKDRRLVWVKKELKKDPAKKTLVNNLESTGGHQHLADAVEGLGDKDAELKRIDSELKYKIKPRKKNW